MYLAYNFNYHKKQDFKISENNRAFTYGDGLFETLRAKEGEVLFFDDHWERLTNGIKALGMRTSSEFSFNNIKSLINELSKKNNLQDARTKIIVWRKEGGLFSPTQSEIEFLITQTEFRFSPEIKETVGIFKDIKLSENSISAYKTLNCLPYILAGIEKSKYNLDDMFLLDIHGHIAESITGNIFFIKNDRLFTPSKKTGCIEGVMKKQIKKYCLKNNIEITEGLFTPTEISENDFVFTCNIAGLSQVKKIESKKLSTSSDLYRALKGYLS